MSTALDARIRSTVKRLLADKGVSITFHTEDLETFDPATAETTTTLGLSLPLQCTPPKIKKKFDFQKGIPYTVLETYMDNSDVNADIPNPQTFLRATYDGSEYRIIEIEGISAGGDTPVLYMFKMMKVQHGS